MDFIKHYKRCFMKVRSPFVILKCFIHWFIPILFQWLCCMFSYDYMCFIIKQSCLDNSYLIPNPTPLLLFSNRVIRRKITFNCFCFCFFKSWFLSLTVTLVCIYGTFGCSCFPGDPQDLYCKSTVGKLLQNVCKPNIMCVL